MFELSGGPPKARNYDVQPVHLLYYIQMDELPKEISGSMTSGDDA